MVKNFLFVALCLLLCCAAFNATAATIYIDEDFEGSTGDTTPFTDQNYPMTGQTTAGTSPTAASIAVKGTNLRSNARTDQKIALNGTVVINGVSQTTTTANLTYTGTVDSTRHFLGAKSLKLDTGQNVAITPGFANNSGLSIHFIQFAIGVATETLPAAGTRVGHFKQKWSTVTTGLWDSSVNVNFVVNSNGGIDVVSSNTNQVVGSFFGGIGKERWAFLSIINNIQVTTTSPQPGVYWEAFDPLTNTFKGPKTGTEPTTFPSVAGGMHIYMNQTTSPSDLAPSDMASASGAWGNNNAAGPTHNTNDMGWEIMADSGTIFLDNLYWFGMGQQMNWTEASEQEIGARCKEFNTSSNEPATVAPASARHWELY